MKPAKIITAILIVAINTLPVFALAQTQPKEPVYLYIKTNSVNVAPTSEIVVSVLINSKQPVNAFDINLEYQKQLLDPLVFDDSDSIVNIWKNRQLDPDNEIIKLSGGMIQPFSGNGGIIANIKFRAKGEGKANISFGVSNVYYSDGSGTKAKVITKPSEITISQDAPLLNPQQINDILPPVFELGKTSKNPGSGKYIAIFSAKDAESGINSLYLRSKQWFIFDEWKPVFSPVELPKGTWQYQIYASDNNNNISIKTSYVTGEITKKVFIVILLFITLSIFYVTIKKWILLKKPY